MLRDCVVATAPKAAQAVAAEAISRMRSKCLAIVAQESRRYSGSGQRAGAAAETIDLAEAPLVEEIVLCAHSTISAARGEERGRATARGEERGRATAAPKVTQKHP